MNIDNIKLGCKAEDIITGREGIITAKIEYINGCIQFCITPKVDKDGKAPEPLWVDWQRVKVCDEGVRSQFFSNPTGGPASDAPASYQG